MNVVPPINFDLYPIEDAAAMAKIVAKSREQLDRDQYCSLPGFLTDAAIKEAAAEIASLKAQANPANSKRNCYLQRQGDPSLPPDHPRNIMHHASYRMIAADLLPAISHLKTLYFWEPFQKMVAGIVGEETLYPNEDPLQPVNVICYAERDQSAWHYDSTNAFTMTLMLQAAEAGGDFEMAPNTRVKPGDEDIPYMREVLTGQSDQVKSVGRAPGELTIFRGCNSLHRVSPVKGPRDRLMAVFVYETMSGIKGDPEVNMTVYGRKA
ncbi:2OG-Fe(II) oxygenase [Pseudohalocynthiibacter aestuariivivens]|uniref:2OG-Fe(II) oxygenase n=1 Tax=Pseudohalocynthiibacter aestuariivivens TaxID=1591409 RepID=A0ABV5JHZ9_9RHOB|nr:2OG-Fe(II) oxygenase [Pseudohalocynthiibacter aestuariivivens]MBS9718993.1 2OG-Fe(II) oxygenase [Pseudohalocynthiibacter aestuariivivens]